METKRTALFTALSDLGVWDPTSGTYDDFKLKFFNDEAGTDRLYDYVSFDDPTDGKLYEKSKEEFYKQFACDLSWASSLTHCKTPFVWKDAPTEDEVKNGTKYLKFGMKGDFVKKVQEKMNEIAVQDSQPSYNVGAVDGLFGRKTKAGITNLQRDAEIRVDGIVGPETYGVIFREPSTPISALPSREVTPVGISPSEPEISRTTGMPAMTENTMENKPTIKESLKKNLKQTLNEKKIIEENLLIEKKIVANRYNLIGNGLVLETEEQQMKFVESLIAETQYLSAQGYSSQAINEGLFDLIGSLFKGSFTSVPAVVGEYIAQWLLKTLGLPKDSYMAGVIIALVGNLNISDYDKFFTDCRFASNKIADSLIEGYIVKLQNEKSMNQGAGGFVLSALRNAVVDYFVEDKNGLIEKLEEKIGDFICPKLSAMAGKMGDVTKAVKDKVVA